MACSKAKLNSIGDRASASLHYKNRTTRNVQTAVDVMRGVYSDSGMGVWILIDLTICYIYKMLNYD